jgi:hypothetical protein
MPFIVCKNCTRLQIMQTQAVIMLTAQNFHDSCHNRRHSVQVAALASVFIHFERNIFLTLHRT